MNRKVTTSQINQWRAEISERLYNEPKMRIIADISERTGLSCSTIYYWFANAEFRSKRKKYCGEIPKGP